MEEEAHWGEGIDRIGLSWRKMSKKVPVELGQIFENGRQGSQFNMRTPETESARFQNEKAKRRVRRSSEGRKTLVQIGKDMESEIILDLKHSSKPEELLSFELKLSAAKRKAAIETRERTTMQFQYEKRDTMINVLEGVALNSLGTVEDFELLETTGHFQAGEVPDLFRNKFKNRLDHKRLELNLFRQAYGSAFKLTVVFNLSSAEGGTGFLVDSATVQVLNGLGTKRVKAGALLNRLKQHRPSLFSTKTKLEKSDDVEQGSMDRRVKQRRNSELQQEYNVFGNHGQEFKKQVLPGTKNSVLGIDDSLKIHIKRISNPDEVLTFEFSVDEEDKAQAVQDKEETETIVLEYTSRGAIRGVFKSFDYSEVEDGNEFVLSDSKGEFTDLDTLNKQRPPILYGSKTSRKRLSGQLYKRKDQVLTTIHAEFQLNKGGGQQGVSCTLSVISLRVWVQDFRDLQQPRNKIRI